jgi:hypothetical protein
MINCIIVLKDGSSIFYNNDVKYMYYCLDFFENKNDNTYNDVSNISTKNLPLGLYFNDMDSIRFLYLKIKKIRIKK